MIVVGVEVSWETALIGGGLIGLSAVLMMVTIGRIAGISGIFANVLKPFSASLWQWAFIAGLLASGLLFQWFYRPIPLVIEAPPWRLVVAGLLVGYGTRLGSGCTSGHGVCGLARFSLRSVVATLVFMTVGILTVFVLHLFS